MNPGATVYRPIRVSGIPPTDAPGPECARRSMTGIGVHSSVTGCGVRGEAAASVGPPVDSRAGARPTSAAARRRNERGRPPHDRLGQPSRGQRGAAPTIWVVDRPAARTCPAPPSERTATTLATCSRVIPRVRGTSMSGAPQPAPPLRRGRARPMTSLIGTWARGQPVAPNHPGGRDPRELFGCPERDF